MHVQLRWKLVGPRTVVLVFVPPNGEGQRAVEIVRHVGGVSRAGSVGGRVLVRVLGLLGRGGLPRVRGRLQGRQPHQRQYIQHWMTANLV